MIQATDYLISLARDGYIEGNAAAQLVPTDDYGQRLIDAAQSVLSYAVYRLWQPMIEVPAELHAAVRLLEGLRRRGRRFNSKGELQ